MEWCAREAFWMGTFSYQDPMKIVSPKDFPLNSSHLFLHLQGKVKENGDTVKKYSLLTLGIIT